MTLDERALLIQVGLLVARFIKNEDESQLLISLVTTLLERQSHEIINAKELFTQFHALQASLEARPPAPPKASP